MIAVGNLSRDGRAMMPQFTVVSALAALAVIPRAPIVEDRCDVVEVNHFYDADGRLVFDQVIFWDWCDGAERHQVRAWRLLKSCSQWPARDWARGGYLAVWIDGERLRVVRGTSLRETWTQYDPELLERQVLSIDARRDLAR
jgi:hypothetical protein